MYGKTFKWTGTSAERLEETIARKKMSYSKLAKRADITAQIVSFLINCHYPNVSKKTLANICIALEIDPEWLLDANKTTVREQMEAAMIVLTGEDVYTRGEACEVIARFFTERAKEFRELEEEKNGN